ncbi:MAG TPA: 3-dehydroquinate synthase [Candidatus Dormibacteraeota bacterium]|nr:3-dehydroquinate synthase [Candidatus Dormibacteraeota bacterium]
MTRFSSFQSSYGGGDDQSVSRTLLCHVGGVPDEATGGGDLARITVDVPGRPYPVVIGRGALQDLPRLVKEMGVTAAAVVTDRTLAGLWGGVLQDGLTGYGLTAWIHAVEPGERAKSLTELERVLNFLEASSIDRRGVVIALGGGTVGDLAGFAAAVWLRGIRCVQVPTTLLAIVDSSIGGKTGVNLGRTKNAVGAYWQPALVVSDLALLETLPNTDYLAAFGEIVKYAVAMDCRLAEWLEADAESLLNRSSEALEPVVARCVELKAKVVAADEREGGLRAILNYGHTVGHAVESASAYTAAHGRAVALGMEAAARISLEMGLCDSALVGRQAAMMDRFGLPGELPPVTSEAVLAAVPRDKKSVGGRVPWVLPREMGRAQLGIKVPAETLARVVRALLP